MISLRKIRRSRSASPELYHAESTDGECENVSSQRISSTATSNMSETSLENELLYSNPTPIIQNQSGDLLNDSK